MKKKGFVLTSVLYPMTVFCTGVMAVLMSTGKTNKMINKMKLDVDNNPFNSATCDCEAINKAIKSHGEKIITIENTIKDTQTIIDGINDKLKYGDATSGDILSGKTALVQGNKVTGSMPNIDRAIVANQYLWTGTQLGENNTWLVSWIPSAYYRGWQDNGKYAETYIRQSDLANTIGLTADKMISTANVLGIQGSIQSMGAYTDALSIGHAGNLYVRIPQGAYVTNTGVGSPEIVVPGEQLGNASQVLSGSTFTSSNGLNIAGTMPSMGAYTNALSIGYAGNLYVRIPQGAYLDNNTGSGQVEIVLTEEQVRNTIGLTADKIKRGETILGIAGTAETDTSATATSAQILVGFTAWVNGLKITGSMPDRTNDTGTTGLAWSTGKYEIVGDQLRVGVNPGYYGTNNYSNWGTSGVVLTDVQNKLGATPDKIKKGEIIAGVTGTYGGENSGVKIYNVKNIAATDVYAELKNGDIVGSISAGNLKKLLPSCTSGCQAYYAKFPIEIKEGAVIKNVMVTPKNGTSDSSVSPFLSKSSNTREGGRGLACANPQRGCRWDVADGRTCTAIRPGSTVKDSAGCNAGTEAADIGMFFNVNWTGTELQVVIHAGVGNNLYSKSEQLYADIMIIYEE